MMYDDDSDEMSPEELLHSSAAPLRRDHPMDGWHEVEPGAPSTWTPSSTSGVNTEPSSAVQPRMQVWKDRWVGWWERRRQAKGKGPSQRAWQEALDYFAGGYRDHTPDPWAFARLVRRNGTPDWPNPFPEGHPRHYDYHPHGLILLDVSTLLEGMAQALDENTNEEPAPRHRDQEEWVTLEDALKDNEDDARAHSLAHQKLAMTAWAMMLAWGNGFSRVKQEVHHDNLTAITVETLLVFDPTPWGMTLPKLAAGAIQAGFVNLPTAQALLRQRALMDQPVSNVAPAPTPKAPPLPLDAWLAKRTTSTAIPKASAEPSSLAPHTEALPTVLPSDAVLHDFDKKPDPL